MDGIVIRNTGSHYVVDVDGVGEVNCKIKGNFRIKGIRTTNPVAVGDHVELGERAADGTAFIVAITPRRNYIIRRASNLSKESHIIAANLDQALLVVTLAHPTTSTTFIDRFLATAQAYSVEAIIAINKTDLLDEEDHELLEAVVYLYESIGYKTVAISAETGDGIDGLKAMLKDKVTLFAGNSGVGKSTLINRLIPGLDLRTGEISTVHDTGMHTTTFSELFYLPEGGSIIDTPGVRGFGTVDFKREEIDHYFPELFALSKDCRFGNCTHTHEPGCAVRAALERNEVAESRYTSYLSILEDTESNDNKYRKGY
jgi:ribosome biogenesis GTPase